MICKFVYYDLGFTKHPFYEVLDAQGCEKHVAGLTVSDQSLSDSGSPIPLTPTKETYIKMISQGVRCGKCFSSIRCLHGFAGEDVQVKS
jgi:hypothetical protein